MNPNYPYDYANVLTARSSILHPYFNATHQPALKFWLTIITLFQWRYEDGINTWLS